MGEDESRQLLPEMKKRDQWMGWFRQNNESGKFRKKPFPHSQRCSLYRPGVARYTDPNNWLSYESARELQSKENAVTGIGFVLTDSDPFVVVDFDFCIQETGEVHPQVAGMIQRAGSYAEVSPSGSGTHLILRGMIPRQGWTMEPSEFRIEIYDRFFVTVTENHLPFTPLVTKQGQEFLYDLFSRYQISWPDPKFTSFWPERER